MTCKNPAKASTTETGVRSVVLGQFEELPFTTEELTANEARLGEEAIATLQAILQAADGFSESTMNDLTDPAWQQIYEITEQ